MDILSRSLVQANKEMKKARWAFDGSIRANANREDQDELWNAYKSIQDSVGKIQSHLELIGKAKADVAKARWWLDVGVYSDSSLSLIYPLDSQRIVDMRLEDAVEKAQAEYNKTLEILDLLLAPISPSFDPWLDQERRRMTKPLIIPQANVLQRESKESPLLLEDYPVQGQQRHVTFKEDVNRTVSRCKQKVSDIKSRVTNRIY